MGTKSGLQARISLARAIPRRGLRIARRPDRNVRRPRGRNDAAITHHMRYPATRDVEGSGPRIRGEPLRHRLLRLAPGDHPDLGCRAAASQSGNQKQRRSDAKDLEARLKPPEAWDGSRRAASEQTSSAPVRAYCGPVLDLSARGTLLGPAAAPTTAPRRPTASHVAGQSTLANVERRRSQRTNPSGHGRCQTSSRECRPADYRPRESRTRSAGAARVSPGVHSPR
jgi:hypothetical protein